MTRKIRWVMFVVTLLCATSLRSAFGAPAQSAQRTNHDAGGTHTIAESRVVAGTLELTGNCLRIGVKNTGSLGIGLTTSPGILFDKTCTGTFNPAYDFLTPGIPWEDLSLKLDGVQYHENNNRPHDFVTNASIENKSGVEYRGTTWALRAVQKSENAAFSIENDFHFNEYSKFIEIHTYVTPKAAVTTLFISRAIDSDAMIDSLDMSGTNNAMGYSTLTANYVVLSETTSTKYVMGLYTGMENGTHTGISRYWSSDPEEYYNGVNYGNGDNTIGVAARFTAVAANTTVVFKHAYIFGQSAYEGVKSAIDEGVAGGTAGSTPGCTGSASVCAPVDVGSAVKTITPGGPTLTRFPTGTPYPTRTGGLSPTPVPSTPSGSTATKTVTRSPTVISTATRSTTRTATTIPTSTTTAPSFTICAFTNSGLPNAATNKSACTKISSMFFVLLWQSVTVQFPGSALRASKMLIGLPTI